MNAVAHTTGAHVTPILEALGAKWGAVGLGLLAGVMAKYGLTLGKGKRITWRMLVADMLLMGLVALVSVAAVEQLGLSGSNAALMAALMAMTSDRVIQMIRERFLKRVEAELYRDLTEDVVSSRGELRQATQIKISTDRIIKGGGNDD